MFFASFAVTALVAAGRLKPVSPVDPAIRYVGRFDKRDPVGPKCAWSASTVELKFRGTEFKAQIRDLGNNFIQVELDGKPSGVWKLTKDGTYSLSNLSDSFHFVRLVKRTEAMCGPTQFVGFQVPNGELLRVDPPKHSIQIVGDSISAAYGNEGKDRNDHYRPETENAYLAYGPIAARALDADCTVVAWSGRKMWPDNTVPEVYDFSIPTDPTSIWDHGSQVPDVVVINLATNDFARGNPPEKEWTGAYITFIGKLQKLFPKVKIYCAIGSMMTDTYPPQNRALSTVRGYIKNMVKSINSPSVKMIEFEQQQEADGYGSDWHPSLKTQQKMGAKLAQAIKIDLGW